MNMQQHILAALREQFDRWQAFLASLGDEQINAPRTFADWSVKDVIAHLRAWQQRSIARAESAVLNRPPEFPRWLGDDDPDENTDAVNAFIYESQRAVPWAVVRADWQNGYTLFLALGQQVSEPQFLDSTRYAWFNGFSLADFYLASYDHHQEHLEKLLAALQAARKE